MRSFSARAPQPPNQNGRDRWLLSYADFVTLLLALFVVLYASARVDADRRRTLSQGLESAFLFDADSVTPIRTAARDSGADTPSSGVEPVPSLHERLREALATERQRRGDALGARLHEDERGLVLSLAATQFFPSGDAEIAEDRRSLLDTLAPILEASEAPLRIEGHTDDRPVRSGLYPSNWELSTARASAVARYFITTHGLDPARFAATGHAEFRPLAENDSAAGRARNRRVEIVLLRREASAPSRSPDGDRRALDRLLDGLPPIPEDLGEELRPRDTGTRSQPLPPP